MLQEHHHMSQNGMQRNTRMGLPPLGQPPNQRTPPMLMSIQPTVPPQHTGVLVTMSQGPALITTTSLPQQPPQAKPNVQQVYHYDNNPPVPAETDQQQPQQGIDSQQQSPNTNTSSVPINTLANIKEKTPMCLVNELARYNKIQHQYRLTGEQGPAHKKVFTVTLKLGNEEYEAEGLSIKKAQHTAAAQALSKTEYKHPPPKNIRNRPGNRIGLSGVVTPTVELNALAMKRGERTVYVVENGGMPPHHSQTYLPQAPYYSRHNLYTATGGGGGGGGGQGQPRLAYDTVRRGMGKYYPFHDGRWQAQHRLVHPPQDNFSVRLRVGEREYPGVGFTVQAARHDAAAKAIEDIKSMGDGDDVSPIIEDVAANPVIDNRVPQPDLNTDLKSPISLVHEIALKRNLNVTFDVLSEKGPPHMKVFITQCRVGNMVAEGEGNGKKISKKRAAEKMLQELGKLPPLPNITTVAHLKRKRLTNKKKTRNLIKVNMDKTSEYTEEINPISRLIQIQQANKEREPVYTVLEERGAARRREFVIEASVNGHSCTGVGPNKKVAKRNAAEALLGALGYASPSPATSATGTIKSPAKEKEAVNDVDKGRKVTFSEEGKEEKPVGGSGGRQLVPGLLLVGDQNTNFTQMKTKETAANNNTAMDLKKPPQPPLKTTPQPISGVRSKDQLMYLAQLMNIQVQFSDFPKANHEMYLTLVSLGTTPAQVCHGEGPTIDVSHEKASLEALKVLSELGLDIGTPPKDNGGGGDKCPVGGKSGISQNGVKK